MNVDSILGYELDPREDFYQILGCDRTSSSEQIQTEFKVRARECHPDKQANRTKSNPERFQRLLKAKNTLTDGKERSYYDAWLDSGLAVSFAQWRGLKDSVKTSIHWAVPKTERMIADDTNHADVAESPPDKISEAAKEDTDEEEDDGVTYEPTAYQDLGYRIPSPVSEWKEQTSRDEQEPASSSHQRQTTTSSPTGASGAGSLNRDVSVEDGKVNDDKVDSRIAMRRKQFATRRESSIGAMLMTNKFDDRDIRSKFRTYEI